MNVRVLLLTLLACIGACTPEPRTQLMLEIYPTAELRAETALFRVSVGTETSLIRPGDPGFNDTPIEIAITPANGDATRRVRVAVSARTADETELDTETHSTRFVTGETRAFRFFLGLDCGSCPDGCRPDGSCVPLDIDPADLPPYGASVPLDAGPADADLDTNPGDTNPGDTNPDDTNPDDTNPADTGDGGPTCDDDTCGPCETCLDGVCSPREEGSVCSRCGSVSGVCSSGSCLLRDFSVVGSPGFGTSVETDGDLLAVGTPQRNVVSVFSFDDAGCVTAPSIVGQSCGVTSTDARGFGRVLDLLDGHLIAGGRGALCVNNLNDPDPAVCTCPPSGGMLTVRDVDIASSGDARLIAAAAIAEANAMGSTQSVAGFAYTAVSGWTRMVTGALVGTVESIALTNDGSTWTGGRASGPWQLTRTCFSEFGCSGTGTVFWTPPAGMEPFQQLISSGDSLFSLSSRDGLGIIERDGLGNPAGIVYQAGTAASESIDGLATTAEWVLNSRVDGSGDEHVDHTQIGETDPVSPLGLPLFTPMAIGMTAISLGAAEVEIDGVSRLRVAVGRPSFGRVEIYEFEIP